MDKDYSKTLDGMVGGGYIAFSNPANYSSTNVENKKDIDIFDPNRRHVDLSGVSAFCTQREYA